MRRAIATALVFGIPVALACSSSNEGNGDPSTETLRETLEGRPSELVLHVASALKAEVPPAELDKLSSWDWSFGTSYDGWVRVFGTARRTTARVMLERGSGTGSRAASLGTARSALTDCTAPVTADECREAERAFLEDLAAVRYVDFQQPSNLPKSCFNWAKARGGDADAVVCDAAGSIVTVHEPCREIARADACPALLGRAPDGGTGDAGRDASSGLPFLGEACDPLAGCDWHVSRGSTSITNVSCVNGLCCVGQAASCASSKECCPGQNCCRKGTGPHGPGPAYPEAVGSCDSKSNTAVPCDVVP